MIDMEQERTVVEVERREGLTARIFVRDFLSKKRPVIASGAGSGWRALQKWSPSFLVAALGVSSVQVSGSFFDPVEKISLVDFFAEFERLDKLDSTRFPIESVIPYLRYPSPVSVAEESDARFWESVSNDWDIPFLPRFSYIRPPALRAPPPNRFRYPERQLLVAPRGACTTLHVDRTNDSALLCCVSGKRVAFLFPPSERFGSVLAAEDRAREAAVYPVKTRQCLEAEDSFVPSYGFGPTLRAILTPGDILFIPKRWPHEVYTVRSSAAITFNFLHLLDLDRSHLQCMSLSRCENL